MRLDTFCAIEWVTMRPTIPKSLTSSQLRLKLVTPERSWPYKFALPAFHGVLNRTPQISSIYCLVHNLWAVHTDTPNFLAITLNGTFVWTRSCELTRF
jgi:hypothetical protein